MKPIFGLSGRGPATDHDVYAGYKATVIAASSSTAVTYYFDTIDTDYWSAQLSSGGVAHYTVTIFGSWDYIPREIDEQNTGADAVNAGTWSDISQIFQATSNAGVVGTVKAELGTTPGTIPAIGVVIWKPLTGPHPPYIKLVVTPDGTQGADTLTLLGSGLKIE